VSRENRAFDPKLIFSSEINFSVTKNRIFNRKINFLSLKSIFSRKIKNREYESAQDNTSLPEPKHNVCPGKPAQNHF